MNESIVLQIKGNNFACFPLSVHAAETTMHQEIFFVTYGGMVPDPFHPARQWIVQDACYDTGPDDDNWEISSKVPQQHLSHCFRKYIGVWPPQLPCPSLADICHVLVIFYLNWYFSNGLALTS